MEKQSFSLKLLSGDFYGQSFIKTVRGPYRPISLLSNLDKAFERLIFKYVYNHFLENNILTFFQSGFRRGDSTVNQLYLIYILLSVKL